MHFPARTLPYGLEINISNVNCFLRLPLAVIQSGTDPSNTQTNIVIFAFVGAVGLAIVFGIGYAVWKRLTTGQFNEGIASTEDEEHEEFRARLAELDANRAFHARAAIKANQYKSEAPVAIHSSQSGKLETAVTIDSPEFPK
ncbi:hypothetical protein BC830DRAFT_1079110 [Chytriomyces sp. MP71]|nr:hypothetical protein BC830DRAFT_1079110 [Chytriomyces sp. MP71]